MAHAIKVLYPDTKFAIGPSIDDGFYYDIDCGQAIKQEDLPKIEAKMKELIKAKQPFVQKEVSKEEALKLFGDMGEIYKVELINELDSDTVTLYEEGGFVDLCRGPHIDQTGRVKAFAAFCCRCILARQ